jgi:endonuclease-3
MKSVAEIIRRLRKTYPDAKCSLDYRNPFELLVATILSAQCTDERVNKVTPPLFEKYPTAEKMAAAPISDLEKMVQSTGFFKNKAKSLKGAAQAIASEHHGKVPDSMDVMIHLPGVGRKTANVVLGNVFDKPDGVVVDTHVGRLSFRLGLTKHMDATKIERDLNKLVPRKFWVDFPHWMIQHGRKICIARAPRCLDCPLFDICPKRGVDKKFYSAPKIPKSIGYKELA